MPQELLDPEIVEGNDETEGESPLELRYAITSYGADMPVDGLVSRIKKGDIVIPGFQRPFTWTLGRASRFIESLLLGLPVPSLFLAKERETGKQLVIDGQQRLRTLERFYDGVWPETGRPFALQGVQPQFEGKTYMALADEDRRRLDDSTIHAIVVRQDEPSNDDSSVYEIFERLNTGGVKLTGQEIRTAIYRGEFIELLKELDQLPDWRTIIGSAAKGLRDEELILRFLAFYFEGDKYERPMKSFLNGFAGNNRHLTKYDAETIRVLFRNTTTIVARCLGPAAFRPKRSLNAAIVDAILVGIARRLEQGPISDCGLLKDAHQLLLADTQFRDSTEQSTAGEQSVRTRLRLAVVAFGKV